MAQLITMRQRIKAVETIKKITHAMRLISMSTHSRLRHKKAHLEKYKVAFQQLSQKVKSAALHKEEVGNRRDSNKHLIIIVGSQKGLCGTFNSSLFKFFENDVPDLNSYHFISVGKYVTDYLKSKQKMPLVSYNDFNSNIFVSITQEITEFITTNLESYRTVTIYSNYSKSFFIQRPRKFVLLPISKSVPESTTIDSSDYLFEQSPEELSVIIQEMMIAITLQEILFESLLAEQSARFISMDSSTRNADNLLVSMKLEYNKTRQASITKELTELSTSY